VKIDAGHLLTSSEVGVLLQVNPSSVKKWVDDGLLVAFRTPGGHRRIRVSDLISFLESHRMPIPSDLRESARKRVLVVDDDLAHLKVLARAIGRHSDRVEVVTSTNGIDALVLVGSFRPHVILLDIVMPMIDGLEVCQRLKANPDTRNISVVIVSGHVTPVLKRRALEAGAVRCLPKPVTVPEIMDVVMQTPSAPELLAHGE
jgi:excisionase family DNA binding protein